eukprot:m.10296 g.10296  ORF g.10296 m.10296 type:complete len:624 (-) comp8237_c0_seq1:66-1937(-)
MRMPRWLGRRPWRILLGIVVLVFVLNVFLAHNDDNDQDEPEGELEWDGPLALKGNTAERQQLPRPIKKKTIKVVEEESNSDYFKIIHKDGTVEKRKVIKWNGRGVDPKHMHGPTGYFENGSLAYHQRVYPNVDEETIEQKKQAHDPNCFNLFRSDSLPLDHEVPDVRSDGCKAMTYSNLPQVSVVFVFFNEPLSPLLRSISSVLDRSPPHLIKEIILVDDGSDREYTQEPLERFLQMMPKVTLRRMPFRQGLMDTRVEGAKLATAEIVVFLDSHIQCNHGWLEPLIYRIVQDHRNVVCPIIDSIDPDSMVYTAGGLDIVAFDWGLRQAFPKRDMHETEPAASPGMGGGLFAINRSVFFELGGYDPGMKLYGGEEVELPMRIWMCGFRLECAPCSRVGHIFRTGKYHQGQVYPVPGHVITKNHLRAAKMWMEPKYYDLVAAANSKLPPGVEIGDLSWGQEIKERLHCKNFKWFLDNVYPEMFIPDDPKFVKNSGSFKNPKSNMCFDTMGRSSDDSKMGVYACHSSPSKQTSQNFILTTGDEVRLGNGMYKMCFDRANKEDGIYIWGCHGGKGNQEWKYDATSGQLADPNSGKCVEVIKPSAGDSELGLRKCKSDNEAQVWRIVN